MNTGQAVASFLLLACVAVALSGCSTTDRRIRRNQELFDSYDEDVQRNLREGRVDIGYNRKMVEIALGRPDRVETERTADSAVEYWSYFGYYTTRDHVWRYDSPRLYRSHDGRLYSHRPSMTARSVDIEHRHTYEALRIQFRDGVVTTIKRVQR